MIGLDEVGAAAVRAHLDVALDQLVWDGALYPRSAVDQARVGLFLDRYREGGPTALPPIEVLQTADGHFLGSDGRHRSEAARLAGLTSLPATLLAPMGDLSLEEAAYRRALETAATAALPLTAAERRAAVLRLLAGEPRPTDREVARLTGLSHQTVGRMRGALDGGPLDQPDEPSPGEAYAAHATAVAIADRLVRGIERLWAAQGVTDLIRGRLPGVLADVLRERFTDRGEAARWARRIEEWAAAARKSLEDRSG